MEELNEPIKVNHEPIKPTLGGHAYCMPNSSTPCCVCQDKSNLVEAIFSKINKLFLENKQLKLRSIMKTSTSTWRKIKSDA